jgi:hypothetical protein
VLEKKPIIAIIVHLQNAKLVCHEMKKVLGPQEKNGS